MDIIPRARRLAVFALALMTLFFTGLEGRLMYLQVLCYRPPSETPVYRMVEVEDRGLRGKILDRLGGIIARSIPTVDVEAYAPGIVPRGYSVTAEQTRAHRQEFARNLSRLTGVSESKVMDKLYRDRRLNHSLFKGVEDPDAIEELRTMKRTAGTRGLNLRPGSKRHYPRGSAFAPILGFVDFEHRGVAGLEFAFDNLLQGGSGFHRVRQDGRFRAISEPSFEARPASFGESLVTTLDPVIQEAATRALAELHEERRPLSAQAVVLDVTTGEILAVAQTEPPAPGPPRRQADMESYRCRAVADNYTPGSTIKPIMLAFALEYGLVGPSDVIHCGNGSFRFGSRTLHDIDGGYAELSVPDILVKSSNIGMARILTRLTEETRKGAAAYKPVLEFLSRFGFGEQSVGFRGEERGLVRDLAKFDRNYSLVSLAFGHELAVTAMQMGAAVSAMVNGGIWRRPTLVRGLLYPDGTVLRAPRRPERRVIRQETSSQLNWMLSRVVTEKDSLRDLRPRGYSMGAKTGTADKDHDRSKKTVSMFTFGPVQNPRVVVLVVADEPETGRFASQIVGPTAAKIYTEAVRSLRVPYDRPEEIADSSFANSLVGER